MFEITEAVWKRMVEVVAPAEMAALPAVSAVTVEAALNRPPSPGEMPAAERVERVVTGAQAMEAPAATVVWRRQRTMPMVARAVPAVRRYPVTVVQAARAVDRFRPSAQARLPLPVPAAEVAIRLRATVAPEATAVRQPRISMRPEAVPAGTAASAEALVARLATAVTRPARQGLFAAVPAETAVRAETALVAMAVPVAMAPHKQLWPPLAAMRPAVPAGAAAHRPPTPAGTEATAVMRRVPAASLSPAVPVERVAQVRSEPVVRAATAELRWAQAVTDRQRLAALVGAAEIMSEAALPDRAVQVARRLPLAPESPARREEPAVRVGMPLTFPAVTVELEGMLSSMVM